MDEADLARFIEAQLVALARATDRDGLAIRLSPDDSILILAGAITAVNNARADWSLFAPLVIERFGLEHEKGQNDG